LNGFCAVGGPDEGYILLGQCREGFRNIGKAMDKGALIAEDAKCALDLLDGGKLLGPSGEAISFC
jgi:hypothetical protein